jgi:hypothetical protein
VDRFVSESFIPVRIDVRNNPGAMERFDVHWTPTILLLSPDGKERHRIEGFLDADDFLAQLTLGLAHLAFADQQFDRSMQLYGEVVDRLPETDAAPEAQYWRGVSRYKATRDASALNETARSFKERYKDSAWAKKASIWA